MLGRFHHPRFCRLDNNRFAYDVDIFLSFAGDDNLIPGLQLVQLAEDLAIDIVVRRQHQIACSAGGCRANELAHALLQLFPILTLIDRAVDVDRRYLYAARLFWTRRRNGRWFVIVDCR